jgi:hypothetical protein
VTMGQLVKQCHSAIRWIMSWPAMPRRKSVSEAEMLLAVAAAFPRTNQLARDIAHGEKAND